MTSSNSIVPPMLRLPPEILDTILDNLALHSDLLNLALCSKKCKDVVIPRHSEYRIIRVHHSASKTRWVNLWTHLARRADLAKNVREVHVVDDYRATERVPSRLLKDQVGEGNAKKDMCVALSHMHYLHTFTSARMVELDVLSVLGDIDALEHLTLSGNVGHPLWLSENLRSLVLQGSAWVRPQITNRLKDLFKLSPSIEYLELPLDLPTLASATFPELKSLRLFLQSGTRPHADKAWLHFLERHPSIEELSWHPIAPICTPNPNELLPNLKSLQTNEYFFSALPTKAKKRLEELDLMVISGFDVLDELSETESSLKKLRIHDPHSIGFWENARERVALLSPTLEYLGIFAGYHEGDVDAWVSYLARFPNLQTFRGEALWSAVGVDLDAMHQAIGSLVVGCPELRELDHRSFDKHREGFKRIVIIREQDGETVNVRYEIKRPEMQLPFRFMKSVFV